MTYYFVEQKFPLSDPNMDLDFTNDILYQHIIGDESIIDPDPYDNGNIVPNRRRQPRPSDISNETVDSRNYGRNVVILFIILMIMLFMIFYFTDSFSSKKPGFVIPLNTVGINNGAISSYRFG